MGVDVDVAVIGGGAVGLAVAVELASASTVAVIEQHGRVGMETSSHNSGVIHAGIYYPAGSLKHRLCIEGNRLLYEWCTARGVRAYRTGKLIIAVDAGEIDALEDVRAQAEANGVPGLSLLTAKQVQELEPQVHSVGGIWSGTSGVLDQAAYAASLASAFRQLGGSLALEHEVVAIDRTHEGFTLSLRDPDGSSSSLACAALVSSAGLRAPAVAAMLGYPLDGADGVPPMRQWVNKGRYYDIVEPAKARTFRHLVYPVPEHAKGGLGVHITVDVDGGAHLGPDTEWLDDGAPLDYRADDLRRDEFLAAARRYLPFLDRGDIAPGQVGYRPKLQRPAGPPADFLIWHDRRYVHLGGIESPGLTASLAIAGSVSALLT